MLEATRPGMEWAGRETRMTYDLGATRSSMADQSVDTGARPRCLDDLADGKPTTWTRPAVAGRDDLSPEISSDEVRGAAMRMARFAPVLKELFSANGWDGRVLSALRDLQSSQGTGRLLLKADHDLPMTGSIKARGGVHELLAYAEEIALDNGLIEGGSYNRLTSDEAKAVFSRYTVTVASTGNLGYSIGLVARAFGLAAEIHMSHEARPWKKDRLKAIGASVVEHEADYSDTVAQARASARSARRSYFVDDEDSRRLFTGFAAAGAELAEQLRQTGILIGPDQPLVVYLPCGVGGAPGGITFGLKKIFGSDVVCVFVEPVESACMLPAMAVGFGKTPSAYEFGRSNVTVADGLAVPRASKLVVDAVGGAIDAVVTVTDREMLDALRWAWTEHGLRLEPAAAAAFAGRERFRQQPGARWRLPEGAVEVVWTTGGAQLPDEEFSACLAARPA